MCSYPKQCMGSHGKMHAESTAIMVPSGSTATAKLYGASNFRIMWVTSGQFVPLHAKTAPQGRVHESKPFRNQGSEPLGAVAIPHSPSSHGTAFPALLCR